MFGVPGLGGTGVPGLPPLCSAPRPPRAPLLFASPTRSSKAGTESVWLAVCLPPRPVPPAAPGWGFPRSGPRGCWGRHPGNPPPWGGWSPQESRGARPPLVPCPRGWLEMPPRPCTGPGHFSKRENNRRARPESGCHRGTATPGPLAPCGGSSRGTRGFPNLPRLCQCCRGPGTGSVPGGWRGRGGGGARSSSGPAVLEELITGASCPPGVVRTGTRAVAPPAAPCSGLIVNAGRSAELAASAAPELCNCRQHRPPLAHGSGAASPTPARALGLCRVTPLGDAPVVPGHPGRVMLQRELGPCPSCLSLLV